MSAREHPRPTGGEPAISEPLELEVFFHALRSGAEEMGTTLIRTARSVNIRERHDASCAIFTVDGELLVSAEHHPAHLGALLSMIPSVLRRYPLAEMSDGDIFLGNDPYNGGGTHIPDVTVAAPVFWEGAVIGFVATMGHWIDTGGKAPGAGTEGSTEIYQEGLRILPIRIYTAGRLDRNLLDLITANTRTAELNVLDFMAQVACTEVGRRRVKEVVGRYSVERFKRLARDMLTHSEMEMRAAVAGLPEGRVTFRDTLDDDGHGSGPVYIQVAVDVSHHPEPRIVFDFTGTDPQREGSTNTVVTGVNAGLLYVLKTLVDPDMVITAGTFRAFEIVAPKGTVVNAQEPTAVGARGPVLERIVEAVLGAVAGVVPERVVACSSSTTSFVFSWHTGESREVEIHLEGIPGGMGARSEKDGPDGVEVHTTNMATIPIEITERIMPVMVERFELVPDTGGAGRRRGGLATRKDYRLTSDIDFRPHGDRHKFAPWGLSGGMPGGRGRFWYERGGEEVTLPSKGSAIPLLAGDLLCIQTPGGGGYGDPAARDPEMIDADVLEEKVSAEAAARDYGRTK
jgi:N-methylhydantoinase B